MKTPKLHLSFSLGLLALASIFALQNMATVEVQFLFWSMRLPRALMILLVLVVGLAAGWFLRGARRRHRN